MESKHIVWMSEVGSTSKSAISKNEINVRKLANESGEVLILTRVNKVSGCIVVVDVQIFNHLIIRLESDSNESLFQVF